LPEGWALATATSVLVLVHAVEAGTISQQATAASTAVSARTLASFRPNSSRMSPSGATVWESPEKLFSIAAVAVAVWLATVTMPSFGRLCRIWLMPGAEPGFE